LCNIAREGYNNRRTQGKGKGVAEEKRLDTGRYGTRDRR